MGFSFGFLFPLEHIKFIIVNLVVISLSVFLLNMGLNSGSL